MDLLTTSVRRALGVLGLAALLAAAGCVSEKGQAGGEAGTSGDDDSSDEVTGTAGTGGARAGAGGSRVTPDPLVDVGLGTGSDGGTGLDGSLDDSGDGGGDGGGAECAEGFVAGADGCVRDHCRASDDEPAACSEHGSCSDGTEDEPTCECDEGYELEDLQCVRNPCIAIDGDAAACDDHASCSYEGDGEASCECDEGYDGDGESCERNACVQLDDEDPPCGDNEACTPTGPGETSCACDDGFGDCDEEASNGCELDLTADALNCGTCEFACAADLACDGSECQPRLTDIVLGFYVSLFVHESNAVLGSGTSAALLHGEDPSDSPIDLSLPVASLPQARRASINTNHACLVHQDPTGATCWGSNTYLQLGATGTGTTYASLSAPNVKAIAAGNTHTCLVAATGKVYCWGSGAAGGFGDGNSPSTNRSFADTFGEPGVPVLSVDDAVDVDAGITISCAIIENGRVYCWGSNSGTAYSPELVRDADGDELTAEDMCVGQNHACALRDDGVMVCWGSDTQGQLGTDSIPGGRNRYVEVLSDVKSIACGGFHSCALLESGAVYCWGTNGQGQLGSGDTTPSPTPIPMLLPESTHARAVFSGSGAAGTCAELTDGSVYCTGYNYYGQLGVSSGDDIVTTPREITDWP